MRERGAVVVTGAGSGIGREVANRLDAEGRRVVRLGLPGSTDTREFDVCEEANWRDLSFDGVTGLVHAAGIRLRSRLSETSLEEFERVLRVNTVGTFLALRWVARAAEAVAGGNDLSAAHAQERSWMSVVTFSSAAV